MFTLPKPIRPAPPMPEVKPNSATRDFMTEPGSQPDLNSLLIELTKFGVPMLHQSSHSNRWVCSVEMHVGAKGATFDIRARDHSDPISAAIECRKLIDEALRTLTVNVRS